jgi:hypothetical protein
VIVSTSNVRRPSGLQRIGGYRSVFRRARTLTLELRVGNMNGRETWAEIVSIAPPRKLGIMTELRILLPCLMDASDYAVRRAMRRFDHLLCTV